MKLIKTKNKFKYLVVNICVILLFTYLIIAPGLGLVACSRIPLWKKEAKKAFQDAKFAPSIEDVVPGSALNTSDSSSETYSTVAALMPFSDSGSLLVSETGPMPDLDYLTLEDEIRICINRINSAEIAKEGVLQGIDNLTEANSWQNNTRLIIAEDGALEYRFKYANKDVSAVRLSADKTTVEIIRFPFNIMDKDRSYEYSQFSSYDGETFVDMDCYNFFRSKNSVDFSSMHINYREYKKAENGIVNSFLVQTSQEIEYGEDDLPTGNTYIDLIDITAYGGNNDTIYRHWHRIADGYNVGTFNIANAENNIQIDYDNYNRFDSSYKIFASAQMFNIDKLYLAEVGVVQDGAVISNILAVELLDGTILYAGNDAVHWGGHVIDFTAQDVRYAQINFYNLPVELSIEDAVKSLGFEFIDVGLDFSSISNGDALKLVENIRISKIEEIKEIEITIENALVIYLQMYEFYASKMV